MSTITAILYPDSDGTLHLPLPEDLRHGKVRVEATLTSVVKEQARPLPKAGSLKGFWISPDFDEPLQDFQEYME
jgi:hypothetical protein